MYLSKIINGKHLLIFNLREKITRYFIKIYLYVHTLQKWPCNEGFDAHNDSRESFSAFRDLQIPILLFFSLSNTILFNLSFYFTWWYSIHRKVARFFFCMSYACDGLLLLQNEFLLNRRTAERAEERTLTPGLHIWCC